MNIILKKNVLFLRNEEKYFTALASNSLKNFGRMVNDFEIVPFLLSKPNAYGLFRDVAKKKIIPDYIRNELEIYLPDKSDRKVFGVFTYVHFLCALTLIGDKICDGVIESYFPKHTQNTKPFIYLMGHMIAANPLKGKFFLDFPLDSRHQLNAVSPSRTSLFSDDPTGQRRKGGGLGRSSDFAPSQRRVSQNNAVQRKSTPGRLQDENNAPKSAPSLHQRVVKQLFSYYAALGSPMNRTFMSTIKWNRFLRDAGILDDTVKKEGFNRSPSRSLSPRQSQRLRRSMSSAESDMERVVSPLRGSAKKGMLTLKQVDADLIFLQSQNNNTVRHHMTEDIFEIALTFLAEKLYDQKLEKFIHSDGAYVALVNDILRPLSEKLQSINGNEIQGCAVAFQQPEITRVFKTAEDGLDRLFKSYTRTSSHGTLWSAEKFSKFCNDFEITNELSHKPLQRIFSDCVHFFYAQGKGHAREMSKETFQLALLMVAIHLTKDEELSLPKKLAMLFHRFNSVGSSNNLKGGKSAFLRVNASLYSPPREVPLRRSAVAASLRNSYTWSALMNDPLAGRLTEPTAAR